MKRKKRVERKSSNDTYVKEMLKVEKQKIIKLKKVFTTFDHDDNDFGISQKDLGKVFNRLGNWEPSKEELEEMLAKLKPQHAGMISLDEMSELMQMLTKERARTDSEILESFEYFDVTGSGFITKQELMVRTNNLPHKPSKNEIDNILKEVDVAGDGKICYAEFVLMMKKKEGVQVLSPKQSKQLHHVFDEAHLNVDHGWHHSGSDSVSDSDKN